MDLGHEVGVHPGSLCAQKHPWLHRMQCSPKRSGTHNAVDAVRCAACGYTFGCGVGAPGLLQFEEGVNRRMGTDAIKAHPFL
eukprot:scaffold13150_cov62-Phaeocystis_antarctica.AAC.7